MATIAELEARIDKLERRLRLSVSGGLELHQSDLGTVISGGGGGGTLDVVVDVNYTPATGVLKQTKRKISASALTSGSDSTIDTAEAC